MSPTQETAQFPAVPKDRGEKQKRRKRTGWLVAVAVVVVAVLGGGAAWLFWPSSSVTTYSAEECKEPGETDEQGFTGCMRQLAGHVAQNNECAPGTGTGAAAAANEEQLGATVTCSAPGLAGAQITYLHASSTDVIQEYTDGLISRTGGGDLVQAAWKGNGLSGRYTASGGRTASVIVFTVDDRPLAGFVYQINITGEGGATPANDMADYFEQVVQPGE